MSHAFFADMGGFVLHAPNLTTPIPLNAEQVFYLVEKQYIEYPNITEKDISDKNKSDGLTRLVSLDSIAHKGENYNNPEYCIAGLSPSAKHFGSLSTLLLVLSKVFV